MAIGIDKYGHTVLLEKLETLIKKDKDTSHWHDRKQELTTTYQRISDLVHEIEQHASDYKQLRAEIVPEVSEGMRRLRKTEK